MPSAAVASNERTQEEISLEVREDPLGWFEEFSFISDEETRKPIRPRPNILQQRMMEHYRRCQQDGKPCRMVTLKYRRAGASTASEALVYVHAQNHNARIGVIGTNYQASSNMLEMLSYIGEHDEFPGWTGKPAKADMKTVAWQDWYDGSDNVPWTDRVDKIIATKVVWSHGSVVELYTANNPESARSAGLNGYHATEVGRWKTGGVIDAVETLMSMRNTLPKTGFHLAIEESTADGASGPFHDTCRKARYPEYAKWPEMHKSCWPLNDSEYGRDLQFVFIFAAWFEDSRHRDTLTPEQARKVEQSLDAEQWYYGEKELIAKYSQPGPNGIRLGSEVDATIWEQLAWRRGIIQHVCTRRGLDEFAQEYPANPLEAFRASGAPVFSQEGIMALDEAMRHAKKPECGVIDMLPSRGASFRWTPEAEAVLQVWEDAIPGCRYLISVDPTKDAEIVKGTGERDRNAILVIRDGYQRSTASGGKWFPTKVVARVKPPNAWGDAPLSRIIAQLAAVYGGAIIVVESNLGSGLITRLRDEYHCNLYCRESWDLVRQRFASAYGWDTNEATRRQCISVLQEAINEQTIEVLCPNIIAELRTFVYSSKGKAEAASGSHDDDVLSLSIGLACMSHASTFTQRAAVTVVAPDELSWKEF